MRWPGRYAALLREVRQAPPPALDEARVRARVQAEVTRARLAPVAMSEVRQTSRGWSLALAAGGLALAALVWQQSSARGVARTPALPAAAVSTAAAGSAPAAASSAEAAPVPGPELRDGATLRPGERLVAGERALRVEHAGHSAWSLSAGSAARLLTLGDVLRIELEQGVLSAEVQPRAQSAAGDFFVVQSRGAEVSVHGTRFSVSAPSEGAEQLLVDVQEGLVRVRPTGGAHSVELGPGAHVELVAGQLVKGRASASATPERARGAPGAGRGGRSQRALDSAAPAPLEGVAPAPAVNASGEPASAAAAERSLPTAPSLGEGSAPVNASALEPDAHAVGRVVARIQGCFHRYTRDRGDMRIQARSTLRLDVLPSGELLRAELEPPLAPGIERCLDDALAAVRFEPSDSGYRIERSIQLSTE
jgi:FecR-like protein